jgi:bacterioferritin
VQLGGEPNLNPLALHAAGDCEDIEAGTLADMLEEDLIAERIAIESYREIVQYLGTNDPTTRQLLESILAVEAGHAEELASMREQLLRKERAAGGATSVRLPVLQLVTGAGRA